MGVPLVRLVRSAFIFRKYPSFSVDHRGTVPVMPRLARDNKPPAKGIRSNGDDVVEKRGDQIIETAHEARQAEPGPERACHQHGRIDRRVFLPV